MLRDPRSAAGLLAMLITLIVSETPAWGCGCPPLDENDRQHMDMGHVMHAAQRYYQAHGAIPVSDADSSWYEKLVDGAYAASPEPHFGLARDARVPADKYGHPLILEYVQRADGMHIVVRSVGANGIDDHGALDDWEYGREPNLGYWYKEDWVADSLKGAAVALLSAVLCVVIGLMTRRNVTRVVWSLLIIGVLDGLIISATDLSASTHPAPFIEVQGVVGMLVLLFGALAGITCAIGAAFGAARRRSAESDGLCRVCRYDLRGTDSPRCPECGSWREQSLHDAVIE